MIDPGPEVHWESMNLSNGGEGGQDLVNSGWFDPSGTPWLYIFVGAFPKQKWKTMLGNQCLSPKSRGNNKGIALGPTK